MDENRFIEDLEPQVEELDVDDFEENGREGISVATSHADDFVTLEQPADTSEFSKWRLDFSDIFKQLRAFYTGHVEVNGKVIRVSERLLSDDAANALLGYLNTIINKSTVLSNLYDHEIYQLTALCDTAVAEWLVRNARKFKIKPKHWGTIFVGTHSIIYTTLTRARGGGERESLAKTITESIHKETSLESREEKEHKSIFPFFR